SFPAPPPHRRHFFATAAARAGYYANSSRFSCNSEIAEAPRASQAAALPGPVHGLGCLRTRAYITATLQAVSRRHGRYRSRGARPAACPFFSAVAGGGGSDPQPPVQARPPVWTGTEKERSGDPW